MTARRVKASMDAPALHRGAFGATGGVARSPRIASPNRPASAFGEGRNSYETMSA
jgi:hypothetical protein